MRTPDAKIRAAILHSTAEVRDAALKYFAEAHTTDESLMPLVIQAVEKYGRKESFSLLRTADELPQTPATVSWIADELAQPWNLEDSEWDNYCFALALILCNARTELLRPELADWPCFPAELKAAFGRRLEMAAWDWNTTWKELEALGDAARARGYFRQQDIRHEGQVVEALARHPDKEELVLRLLERRYRGFDKDLLQWLEFAVVDLAGHMRLEAAVPILVERIREDDEELADSCVFSLPRIGGDCVVQAIADVWGQESHEFRGYAADVLGRIHTDLCVQKCLEFLPVETDEFVKDMLAQSLLDNFVAAAVEPVRAMVVGDAVGITSEQMNLRDDLVAAATIMGVSFAELPQWYASAVDDRWGKCRWDVFRMRENFVETDEEDSDDEYLDPEFEEELADMEFDDELDDEEFDDDVLGEEPERVAPIRNITRHVGRNEPCPCGSGKKYKKCCMGRETSTGGQSDISIFE